MNKVLHIRKDGWIILNLSGKEYKCSRKIGRLKDRILYIYRMSEKHVMKSVEGYGFCEQMISEVDYDKLAVKTETGFLETTKAFILTHGTIYHAEGRKLERQIFLPFSKFGMQQAHKWQIELDKKYNPFFAEYNRQMGWIK